jgi:hypothetical protein
MKLKYFSKAPQVSSENEVHGYHGRHGRPKECFNEGAKINFQK